MITKSKFVIVGKEGCVWCDKTKALFHDRDIEFLYIEAKDTLRDFLIGSNLITVPQVFNDGHLIGGHEETVLWMEKHYG